MLDTTGNMCQHPDIRNLKQTYVRDDTATSQTALLFRSNNPFQHVPHVTLVTSTRQAVRHHNRRGIRGKRFMVRRGDIDCTVSHRNQLIKSNR